MHTHTYSCTHIHTHPHTYILMHTHTYTCTHIHTQAHSRRISTDREWNYSMGSLLFCILLSETHMYMPTHIFAHTPVGTGKSREWHCSVVCAHLEWVGIFSPEQIKIPKHFVTEFTLIVVLILRIFCAWSGWIFFLRTNDQNSHFVTEFTLIVACILRIFCALSGWIFFLQTNNQNSHFVTEFTLNVVCILRIFCALSSQGNLIRECSEFTVFTPWCSKITANKYLLQMSIQVTSQHWCIFPIQVYIEQSFENPFQTSVAILM